MIKYMHTINSQPATFIDQISFSTPRGAVRLCNSMDEIREQRKLSKRWRRKHGWDSTSFEYGFQKVAT